NGAGNTTRPAGSDLRAVPPGGQLEHEGEGRHGPWPRHRQADRRDARRPHLGRVDAGQRIDVSDGAPHARPDSQEDSMRYGRNTSQPPGRGRRQALSGFADASAELFIVKAESAVATRLSRSLGVEPRSAQERTQSIGAEQLPRKQDTGRAAVEVAVAVAALLRACN